MIGRLVPWMAAALAGLLALAASAQEVQKPRPAEGGTVGVGTEDGREMTWSWRTDAEPGCLGGPCKGPLSAGQCGIDDAICAVGKPDNPPDCAGAGCDGKLNCRPPLVSGPTFRVEPANGGFKVRMELDVRAPWNAWARTENPAGTLRTFWSNSPTATACGNVFRGTCEYVASDHTRCSLTVYLGCKDAPLDFGTDSFRAEVCGGGCLCEQDPQRCPCWQHTDRNGLRFVVTKKMLGCPE